MIGIASPSFCFSSFNRVIEDVSRHFRLWEILVEVDHAIENIEEEIDEAVRSFDVHLQLHAPMSDVNIGSVYERMRLAAVDDIQRTAEFCRRHEIRVLTIHPGFYQGIAFFDRSRVVEQTKRSMKEVAAIADEQSVTIALENMPKGINATCVTASELFEVVEGTGLGICFDMGHANTAGHVDAFLGRVDLFRNVHLHNNDGSFDQHSIIDQGTANLAEIVSTIVRGGYEGNIIIEASDLESGVTSKGILEGLLVDPPTSHAL
jgi:sugar phosphate isomerase/epimerase